jgi:hypothetical protein
MGTDEYLAMEAALRRSQLRLEAVKRYRSDIRSSRPSGRGAEESE